jgi:hypothetical protein
MKRHYLIAVGLLACVCVLLVLKMLPAKPGVTKANFDRIEDGMTLAEVEDIFGLERDVAAVKERAIAWEVGDGPWAVVQLLDGRVAGKRWDSSNETVFGKISRWLGFPSESNVLQPP